jgi:3-polyprenyl-4-hydroxybenzoate decarboxylase
MAISFMPIIIVMSDEDDMEDVALAIEAIVSVVDVGVDIVVIPDIAIPDVDMPSMLIWFRGSKDGWTMLEVEPVVELQVSLVWVFSRREGATT